MPEPVPEAWQEAFLLLRSGLQQYSRGLSFSEREVFHARLAGLSESWFFDVLAKLRINTFRRVSLHACQQRPSLRLPATHLLEEQPTLDPSVNVMTMINTSSQIVHELA